MAQKVFNNHIELSEPTFYTYRLMYKFGAWVSMETFAAESDNEAIWEADHIFNSSSLRVWEHEVALFCGNRKVKSYK